MKFNINISGEIPVEELIALKRELEKSTPVGVADPCHPREPADSWTGKAVRIKLDTPESTTRTWVPPLSRDKEYVVTKEDSTGICIDTIWYPKISFELVHVTDSDKK